MKKFTKTFTFLTSVAILLSSVSAVSSFGAWVYKNDNEYDEYMVQRGYTEFDDYGVFESIIIGNPEYSFTAEAYLENYEPYRCFYKENHIVLSESSKEQKILTISVPEESDDEELIDSIINEIVPEWSYERNNQSLELDGVYNYFLSTDLANEEAYEKALVLCAELNKYNLVKEFIFKGRRHTHIQFDYPTDKLYFTSDGYYDDFDPEAVAEYLDTFGIKYEINNVLPADIPAFLYKTSNIECYSLTLEEASTWQDYVYVQSLINQKFYVGLAFEIPESAEEVSDTENNILTQINSSYGDMNNSGGIDMSDAVSIMAHATNPEAYPLTDLQLLLGDVYQQGDGIGINDAVSIQKYLTKQITSLPESTM